MSTAEQGLSGSWWPQLGLCNFLVFSSWCRDISCSHLIPSEVQSGGLGKGRGRRWAELAPLVSSAQQLCLCPIAELSGGLVRSQRRLGDGFLAGLLFRRKRENRTPSRPQALLCARHCSEHLRTSQQRCPVESSSFCHWKRRLESVRDLSPS